MKKHIEEFIGFLETTDIQYVAGDIGLQDLLDERYPKWRKIVKDPESWEPLEKFAEKRHELIRVMLSAGGGGLVSSWFGSESRDIRDATMLWLQDLAWGEAQGAELTPELWAGFSDEVKDYIIEHLFGTETQDSHEFYRMLFNIVEEDCLKLQERLGEEGASNSINIVLPPVGYLPSVHVRRLLSTVEKAGDEKFVALVEKLIEEKKEAYKSPPLFHNAKGTVVIYPPTRFQRMVITPLLERFRHLGFVLSPLPAIYTSLDIPPALLLFQEKLKHQKLAMEELFVVYDIEPSITIYEKGIEWVARKKGLSPFMLLTIAFLYGVCGWAIQRLEKPELPPWPLEHYAQTPLIVRSTLAYIFTELVIEEIGGEPKDTFHGLKAFLNQILPAIYDRLKTASIEKLIEKICTLRRLGRPATIDDLVEGV